ncbi:MAG TPA: IPT/TIG domain-containing protein [Pyrinomonadaceae bacterium]|nr:IPT/TIG domain-containing protein [Pyrinomonadaceae bacterium]
MYDELGRLVAVIDTASEAAVYKYDAVGNLLSISRYSTSLTSIIEFTPNSGSIGATVTIYGTGFSTTASQNSVTFNGQAAATVSATSTKIVTTVPAGATTGPISVTTPLGSGISSTAFEVTGTSTGAPVITGFTPTIGSYNTPVTITGTNFETTSSNNNVTFNTSRASVDSSTATNINAKTPLGTSGRISVATPYGNAVSSGDFFIPPSPYTAADVVWTGRTTIGSSGTVTINTVYKVGLLVFDGTAGQRLSVRMSNMSAGNRDIYIRRPDGLMLTYKQIVNSTFNWFIEPAVVPLTGTYTVLVDPESTRTGTTTVNLYDVPPDTAGPISINGPSVSVTTSAPGQNGRLTFDGTTGQRVSLKISGSTIASSDISILKPDGATLVAPTTAGASGFIDTTTLPATGTYTIFINPAAANTGSMTLTLYEVPPDATGTIVPGGPSVTVTNTTPGQNAQLVFNGTAGQRVSLKIESSTYGSNNSQLFLKNPDGTTLASDTNANTNDFIDTRILSATGTYTILIDPKSSLTGAMTLRLYDVPADVTGTMEIGGPAVTVTTVVPGQNAQITFSGVAGQQVNLRMTGVTIPGTTAVLIKKPDGTTFVSGSSTTSGGFIDTQTLPIDGTYTVLVDPAIYNTGSMTLTLNSATDITGTIVIGGPTLTLSITVVGQNARIAFDGSAGQRVSLGMSGVTIGTSGSSGTKVSIKNPDGTTLLAPTDVGTTGGGTSTLTLPATGTYSILVDPQSTNTGNITLTLSEELTGSIIIGDSSVPLSFGRVGQNAQLTFTGNPGQRVSFGMSGVTIGTSGTSGTKVSIKNPDGTTLLAPIDVGISGGGTITVLLSVAGTYYVVVDPQGANTGNLTLTLSEEITGTVSIGGSSLSLSLSRAGQNGQVTFGGTAGQKVSLGLSGVTIGTSSTSGTKVLIKNPDGTTLLAAFDVGTSGTGSPTVNLPSTGTYAISVDPQFANVGDITLTLSEDATGNLAINGPAFLLTTTRVGQNARVTFDGASGQLVTVRMTSNTMGAVAVKLLNPDGTTLTSLSSGSVSFNLSQKTLPATGTYTVTIDLGGLATGSIDVSATSP